MVFAAVTYLVQGTTGAFSLHVPLATRLENAVEAYVVYIFQLFFPTRLAAIYVFPKTMSLAPACGALAILLGISALVIAGVRRRPYLAVGWFWYLGTLVPVIGLVQVGFQSHADRYTYIPMLGLSIRCWPPGAADAVGHWPSIKVPVAVAAAFSCAAFMVLTFRQAAYWKNTETLFQHAADVTQNNWMAEGFLGGYLMKQPGRRSDAVDHLQAALRINPDSAEAHNNLGLCLLDAGLYDAAMSHFETARRLKPGDSTALNNLGLSFMLKSDFASAIPFLTAAVRAEPDSAEIRVQLGIALSRDSGPGCRKRFPTSRKPIRLQPDSTDAHYELRTSVCQGGTDPGSHFPA